jgi:hypothetical protein
MPLACLEPTQTFLVVVVLKALVQPEILFLDSDFHLDKLNKKRFSITLKEILLRFSNAIINIAISPMKITPCLLNSDFVLNFRKIDVDVKAIYGL